MARPWRSRLSKRLRGANLLKRRPSEAAYVVANQAFFGAPGEMQGKARLTLNPGGVIYNSTPPTTVDFGNATLGTNQFPCSSDRGYGNAFTLTDSGTLASAQVAFEAGSLGGGQVKVVIYTGSGTTPVTRVAVSSAVTITGPGWHTVSFAGEAITAGSFFLIAVTDALAFDNYFAQTTPWAGSDAVMANGTLSFSSPQGTWPGNSATYDQVLSIIATVNTVAPGAMVGGSTLSLGATGTMTNVGSGMIGNAALSLSATGTIINLTPPTTDNFGDENLYTDSLPTSVGRMLGKQFTADASGTLLSIDIGFAPTSAGTFNVKGLVYSDTADVPVTLLATSNIVVHSTGGGFLHATFTAGPAIVSGTKYWLFGMTDDNGGLGEHAHNTFGTGSGEDAFMVQPGSFSFASPPSTMPAATARYDYDVSIYATVSTAVAGAIIGSTSLSLTPAGVATGSGAMAGSATVSLAPTGVLRGALPAVGSTSLSLTPSATGFTINAITGTTVLALTPAGALAGTLALVGTNAFALLPAGSMAAAGALVGSSSLTFAPSASLTTFRFTDGTTAMTFAPAGVMAGAGPMVGASSITFDAEGSLDGAQPQSEGATDITFSLSAALGATGALVGSTAVSLLPAGALGGSGRLIGPALINFAPSGVLTGNTPAVGTTALTFSQTGVLRGTANLIGNATVSLAPSGTIVGLQPGMSGVAGLSFALSATLSANGRLIGAATLTFAPAATGGIKVDIVGSTSLAFTAQAISNAITPIVGSTSIGLTPSATLAGVVNMSGSAVLAFDALATGNLIGQMNGAALIAIAMTAELLGQAALAGTTDLRFTARATPEGYIPPVGEDEIIRWFDTVDLVVLSADQPEVVVWAPDEPTVTMLTVLAGPVIEWEDAP